MTDNKEKEESMTNLDGQEEKAMSQELIKIVEDFIATGDDDRGIYNTLIAHINEVIGQLPVGKWKSEHYTIQRSEQPISIFGKDGKLVSVLDIHLSGEPHNYPKTEKVVFVEIGEKIYSTRHYSRVEAIEQDILEKTPYWEQARNDISKYSQDEIAKIVTHLKDKYPYPELDSLIKSNTDPMYWY